MKEINIWAIQFSTGKKKTTKKKQLNINLRST